MIDSPKSPSDCPDFGTIMLPHKTCACWDGQCCWVKFCVIEAGIIRLEPQCLEYIRYRLAEEDKLSVPQIKTGEKP